MFVFQAFGEIGRISTYQARLAWLEKNYPQQAAHYTKIRELIEKMKKPPLYPAAIANDYVKLLGEKAENYLTYLEKFKNAKNNTEKTQLNTQYGVRLKALTDQIAAVESKLQGNVFVDNATKEKKTPPQKLDSYETASAKTLANVTIKGLIPINTLELVEYGNWVKGKFEGGENVNANAILTQVLAYASEKGWLDANANWKDTKTLEALKADPVKMALVKEMLLLACGRGFGNMKASLGRLTATDAAGALAAFTDGTIAKAMTTTTTGNIKITEKQMGWWAGLFNEKSIITDGVTAALNSSTPAEMQTEVPGMLDQYASLGVFKQDWLVQAAAKVLGEVNYDDYKGSDGKYSVALIADAANKKAAESVQEVDSPAKAACEGLEGLVNLEEQPALDFAVKAGVLYSGGSRKDVRQAAKVKKDDVAGEVFKVGDKYYALTKEYAISTGTADEDVRKVGKKIAAAPLDDVVVQNMLAQEISSKLKEIGVLNEDGSFAKAEFASTDDGKAIDAYLKENGTLAGAKSALLAIASLNKTVEVPAATSIEGLMFSNGSVYDAIASKGLDNQGTLDMIAALNANPACKMDDGVHFSVKETIEEIGKYAPGTAVDAPVNNENVTLASLPVPTTGTAWLDALKDDNGVIAAYNQACAGKTDDEIAKITDYMKNKLLTNTDAMAAYTNKNAVDAADLWAMAAGKALKTES